MPVMSDVFAALADPTRRRILERLYREGARSVSELAAPLTMTRQAVSKHLAVLEQAGLLERERRGRESLVRPRLEPLDDVGAWVEACSAVWGERLRSLSAYLNEEPMEEGQRD